MFISGFLNNRSNHDENIANIKGNIMYLLHYTIVQSLPFGNQQIGYY